MSEYANYVERAAFEDGLEQGRAESRMTIKMLRSFGDQWVCQSCERIITRPYLTPHDIHYTVECTLGREDGKCTCGEDLWLPKAVHDFLLDQKRHQEFVNLWDTTTGNTELKELRAEVDAWRERFPVAGFDGKCIVLSG